MKIKEKNKGTTVYLNCNVTGGYQNLKPYEVEWRINGSKINKYLEDEEDEEDDRSKNLYDEDKFSSKCFVFNPYNKKEVSKDGTIASK